MTKDHVHDEASETEAVDGSVVVDGPGAVAVLLTPDAAEKTAARLNESASDARKQPWPTGDTNIISVEGGQNP